MRVAGLRQRTGSWLKCATARAGAAMCVVLSLALAGCYDQTARVAFKPDGQADLKIDIDFPPDARDLIAFTDAVMQVTQEGSALFGGGLCKAMETAAALKGGGGLGLKAEQVDAPDKVSCRINIALGSSQDAADKMVALFGSPANPLPNNVLSITSVGERRLRITIDFSKGTDTMALLRASLVGAFAATGQSADQAALDRVATTFVPAMVAMGRMMGDKRGFTLAVDALKVIETNGEKVGNSVLFRWSWYEFMRRQFKEKGVDNKVYYAVVEY